MNPILFYLCGWAAMSLVGFVMMGLDKSLAKKGARRIPEKTLLLLAALLGGVGSTAGMLCFRHKTKHLRFRILLPLFAAIHIALFAAVFFTTIWR